MKRAIVSLVVFASMFVLGVVPNAHAKEAKGCTTATLEGPYGLIGNGTVFGQGRGLTAEVDIWTFDGKGTVSLAGTNVSENQGVQHVTGTGAYTVKPDCTGSSVIGVRTFDFVILDDGQQILQIATLAQPRRVVTFVLQKQFPRQD